MISEADVKLDIAVSTMLRTGVILAAAVVSAGWVFYLAHAHGITPTYRYFHGTPLSPLQIVRDGVRSPSGRNTIGLGLLVLIATPMVRVLFCLVGFAAQKDKLYALVSSAVLAILLYSFFFRP